MTSVQSKLTKGRIVVLSLLAAVPSRLWFGAHLVHGSLDQHESAPQTYSWFARLTRVPNTHTHTQTDHATCDSCSNRPHLCTACMGRNRTGLPYSVCHPTAHAPDHPRARRQRYRWQTTTDDDDRHHRPLLVCPPTLCVGGPVITVIMVVHLTQNGDVTYLTRIVYML